MLPLRSSIYRILCAAAIALLFISLIPASASATRSDRIEIRESQLELFMEQEQFQSRFGISFEMLQDLNTRSDLPEWLESKLEDLGVPNHDRMLGYRHRGELPRGLRNAPTGTLPIPEPSPALLMLIGLGGLGLAGRRFGSS